MKNKYTNFGLVAATIIGCIFPIVAHAGSIQTLPPSTSKIEVIGMKKSAPITHKGVKEPAKSKSAEMKKPAVKAEPKTAKAVPAMPKMRTGEIELPVIPVSQVESK